MLLAHGTAAVDSFLHCSVILPKGTQDIEAEIPDIALQNSAEKGQSIKVGTSSPEEVIAQARHIDTMSGDRIIVSHGVYSHLFCPLTSPVK